MITLLVLVLVFAALGALGALALRFGVDSRDGCDWQPYDITAPRIPRW